MKLLLSGGDRLLEPHKPTARLVLQLYVMMLLRPVITDKQQSVLLTCARPRFGSPMEEPAA